MRGRVWSTGGDVSSKTGKPWAPTQVFEVDDSEYADDCAILYNSRAEAVKWIPKMIVHFQLFGLTVHTGPAEQAHKSKSEVGFFAATYATYDHIDTKVHPPIFRNADGDEADFSDIKTGDVTAVPVVFKFKYLGSMVQTSGADVLDVERCAADPEGLTGRHSKK